jgi:hypothetical protein
MLPGRVPAVQPRGIMPPSRGAFCVRVLLKVCPPKQRARGMPDAGRTHGPPAAKKAGGSHHRFSRDNRHSPRNGFNGCFAFSPVRRAFWPPSSAQCVSIVANLIPASGYQDRAI